jgi:hypothetical protein
MRKVISKLFSPRRLRGTANQNLGFKIKNLNVLLTESLCLCGKFFIFIAVLSLISCETTQAVHHKASDLPPEIQKAQQDVYDLEFQMYQAQHDLAIAKINQNEQQLENQKNANPAYVTQYSDMVSKLELRRSQAEERLGLAQQWYSAVQNGDVDTANSIQQQMNQL